MGTQNQTPSQPQPRATTGGAAGANPAGAKLKTLGAFAAGGLASAVITTALLHGWGVLASNGLNPFGDGGKSAYKDTDAQTGTAPQAQAGFAVRPARTDGQGQGMAGQAAAPVVMVAMLPTPAVAQASTVGADVGFVPAPRPTGQAPQPVIARGEVLAKPPAARTGGKPVAATATAGNTGSTVARGGTVGAGPAGGNWVTALMPGATKAAPSPYYYEYTAQKGGKAREVTQQKATLAAASGNNWVTALMGDQPVRRTAGRVSQYQTTQTALGSSAGVGGDRLTGGGTDAVWAKGDVEVKPKDPRKSRISVCTEERGMVSGCVSEEF